MFEIDRTCVLARRILRQTVQAFGVLGLGLLWSAAVVAGVEPFTLAEAVELAVRHSPDVKAREATVGSAEAMLVPAGQLPDPELVVGVDNLPASGSQAGSFTDDFMTMRKIGIMQSFPRAAKRSLRSQRAADLLRVARTDAESSTLDVQRQAAQAWIAAYATQQSLQRLQSLQPNWELQARISRSAVASGRLSASEATGAQSALLEFRDRLRLAEQMQHNARLELARWVPGDADRVLAAMPSLDDLPAAEILTNVHQHASLRAFDAQLDAARTEVALAQAERKPDWSVELDYAKRGPAFSDMVSLEFRVGLPLFAGSRQNPVIAAKLAEVRKVEAGREAELRMHRMEISQRTAEWQSLKDRRASYTRELLPLARERSRLSLAALQAGQSGIKPVLDAQAAEVETELKAIELLGQLGNAWSFLKFQQDLNQTPGVTP